MELRHTVLSFCLLLQQALQPCFCETSVSGNGNLVIPLVATKFSVIRNMLNKLTADQQYEVLYWTMGLHQIRNPVVLASLKDDLRDGTVSAASLINARKLVQSNNQQALQEIRDVLPGYEIPFIYGTEVYMNFEFGYSADANEAFLSTLTAPEAAQQIAAAFHFDLQALDEMTTALTTGSTNIATLSKLAALAPTNSPEGEDAASQLSRMTQVVQLKTTDQPVMVDISSLSQDELSSSFETLVSSSANGEIGAQDAVLKMLGFNQHEINADKRQTVARVIADETLTIGGLVMLIQEASRDADAFAEIQTVLPSLGLVSSSSIKSGLSINLGIPSDAEAAKAFLRIMSPKDAITSLSESVFASGALKITSAQWVGIKKYVENGDISIDFLITRLSDAAQGIPLAFSQLQHPEHLATRQDKSQPFDISYSKLDGDAIENALSSSPSISERSIAQLFGRTLNAETSSDINKILTHMRNGDFDVADFINWIKTDDVRLWKLGFINVNDRFKLDLDKNIEAIIRILGTLSAEDAGQVIASSLGSQLISDEQTAFAGAIRDRVVNYEHAVRAVSDVRNGNNGIMQIIKKINGKARRNLKNGLRLGLNKFNRESLAKGLEMKLEIEQAQILVDSLAESSTELTNSAVLKLWEKLRSGKVTSSQFIEWLFNIESAKVQTNLKEIFGEIAFTAVESMALRIDMATDSQEGFATMMSGQSAKDIVIALKDTFSTKILDSDFNIMEFCLEKSALTLKEVYKSLKLISNGIKFVRPIFSELFPNSCDIAGETDSSEESDSNTDDPSDLSSRDSSSSLLPASKTPRNLWCFSPNQKVNTRLGPKTIKEVASMTNIEVEVISTCNKIKYSPIYFWLHADEETFAEYYVFWTKSNHVLKASGGHLVYTVPCERHTELSAVFAETLLLGDCVLVKSDDKMSISKVIKTEVRKEKGIFSPITVEGSIIVDNVGVSCYGNFYSESLQHFSFTIIRLLYNILPGIVYESTIGSRVAENGFDIPRLAWANMKLQLNWF